MELLNNVVLVVCFYNIKCTRKYFQIPILQHKKNSIECLKILFALVDWYKYVPNMYCIQISYEAFYCFRKEGLENPPPHRPLALFCKQVVHKIYKIYFREIEIRIITSTNKRVFSYKFKI